nr:atherin-like [Aegilops tauschii subsp. strangulata]
MHCTAHNPHGRTSTGSISWRSCRRTSQPRRKPQQHLMPRVTSQRIRWGYHRTGIRWQSQIRPPPRPNRRAPQPGAAAPASFTHPKLRASEAATTWRRHPARGPAQSRGARPQKLDRDPARHANDASSTAPPKARSHQPPPARNRSRPPPPGAAAPASRAGEPPATAPEALDDSERHQQTGPPLAPSAAGGPAATAAHGPAAAAASGEAEE